MIAPILALASMGFAKVMLMTQSDDDSLDGRSIASTFISDGFFVYTVTNRLYSFDISSSNTIEEIGTNPRTGKSAEWNLYQSTTRDNLLVADGADTANRLVLEDGYLTINDSPTSFYACPGSALTVNYDNFASDNNPAIVVADDPSTLPSSCQNVMIRGEYPENSAY